VGLKNRIELLVRWNLLAVKHTAARLISHTRAQSTKVLDLLARLRDSQIGDHIFAARFAGLPQRCSCAVDDFLGNPDEFAICRGLPLLALPRYWFWSPSARKRVKKGASRKLQLG
jgi:hypothetical protein